MAALTDPDRLAAYRDALGNWNFGGYIDYRLTSQALRWIKVKLFDIPLKDIGREMHEYVLAGGEIDEVREQRPEWRDLYEYHYDLRFAIQNTPTYIETRLIFSSPFVPDDPQILVVNIHDP